MFDCCFLVSGYIRDKRRAEAKSDLREVSQLCNCIGGIYSKYGQFIIHFEIIMLRVVRKGSVNTSCVQIPVSHKRQGLVFIFAVKRTETFFWEMRIVPWWFENLVNLHLGVGKYSLILYLEVTKKYLLVSSERLEVMIFLIKVLFILRFSFQV